MDKGQRFANNPTTGSINNIHCSVVLRSARQLSGTQLGMWMQRARRWLVDEQSSPIFQTDQHDGQGHESMMPAASLTDMPGKQHEFVVYMESTQSRAFI